MKMTSNRVKNNLSISSEPKNANLRCRNCNRKLKSILGAIYCPCIKKIEWKVKRSGKLSAETKYIKEFFTRRIIGHNGKFE